MTSNALTAAAAAEIRAECARQRLSYRELARRADRPTTTVSRWINAETPMTLNDFGLLADALGVDPADLLARATLVLTGGRGIVASQPPAPHAPNLRREVSGRYLAAVLHDHRRPERRSSRDDWRIRELRGSHELPILVRHSGHDLRICRSVAA